ncbi:Hypothetical predicted protein, partial [Paramuricea clavata]
MSVSRLAQYWSTFLPRKKAIREQHTLGTEIGENMVVFIPEMPEPVNAVSYLKLGRKREGPVICS